MIIDIDNTVLSCDLRRAMLCSAILGREVTETEVRHDLYCSRILTPVQQKSFFESFLSTKLMFLDSPYPLAASTLDMLRENGIRIVYLSGRFSSPVDKGKVTREFMKRFGLLKEGDETIFKPSSLVYDSDFKRESINRLKHTYDILWAIDDTPHNLKIFKQSGIFCIGITTSYPSLRFDFADMVVDGWDEIKRLLEAGDNHRL
mgnify:CR=1 FL=1